MRYAGRAAVKYEIICSAGEQKSQSRITAEKRVPRVDRPKTAPTSAGGRLSTRTNVAGTRVAVGDTRLHQATTDAHALASTTSETMMIFRRMCVLSPPN